MDRTVIVLEIEFGKRKLRNILENTIGLTESVEVDAAKHSANVVFRYADDAEILLEMGEFEVDGMKYTVVHPDSLESEAKHKLSQAKPHQSEFLLPPTESPDIVEPLQEFKGERTIWKKEASIKPAKAKYITRYKKGEIDQLTEKYEKHKVSAEYNNDEMKLFIHGLKSGLDQFEEEIIALSKDVIMVTIEADNISMTDFYRKIQGKSSLKIMESQFNATFVEDPSKTDEDHGQFNICSSSHDNIDTVKDQLRMIFDDEMQDIQIGKKDDKTEIVKTLSREDVDKIEIIARQKSVMCKIYQDKYNNFIKLRGVSSNILKAKQDIDKILEDVKCGITTIANISRGITWSYMSGVEYIAFSDRNIAILESNQHASSVQITEVIDGQKITGTVDFTMDPPELLIDGREDVGRSLKRQDHLKEYPANWGQMGSQKSMVIEVTEAKYPQEYKSVEKIFWKTMSKSEWQIIEITRIQQKLNYIAIERARIEMETRNSTVKDTERRLWHGTEKDSVPQINATGFNISFCGEQGVGVGVYFVTKASNSAQEMISVPDEDGYQYMYLARVLTGTYTQGKKGIVEPPPKNKHEPEIRFDSVVDNVHNPETFVVFYDWQAYPEYLIKFEKIVYE